MAITAQRRLRYRIEYAGALAVRALVAALPPRLALPLANGIGTLAYAALAKRRRLAIDNLQRSGVAPDRATAARVARASFRHFAAFVVETLAAERLIRADNWRRYVDVSGAAELMACATEPGQGVIVNTAHFGNWEVAAQVIAYHKPVVAVARRMNNPYTHDLIMGRKPDQRFRMIMKHEAGGGPLLRVLKSGEVLALLSDQHARQGGVPVMFFGRPAATHTAAAILHLRTGAPLFFAACIRVAPLRYRLVATRIVHPAGAPRDHAAILALLERAHRELEALIRVHPEQYLWGHRRWRLPTTEH